MNWLQVLKSVAPKGNTDIIKATANAFPGVVAEFGISTTLRQAHFLAQLAHESDGFKTTVEYASGSAYETRRDLGNTMPGDGKRFKGRGLIQLTGRANYAAASKALGVDFVSQPHLAAQFPHAMRIAGWYWQTRKINAVADRDDVNAVTRKINGGLNGIEDRKRYLERARMALNKAEEKPSAPEPEPTMTTSKTGTGAIITGAGGAAVVVKEAAEAASGVKDATSAVVSLGPWFLLGAVLVGFGVWLWLRHRKRKEVLGI